MRLRSAVAFTFLVASSCTEKPIVTVTCGAGTVLDATSNTCVAVPSCGAGARLDPATNSCVGSTVCGPNTTIDPVTNQCVTDAGVVVCGPGTFLDGGACSPNAVTPPCGAGTAYDPQSMECVSTVDAGKACGPGTRDQDGDGLCEAIPVTPTCSGGTRLPADGGECELDPAACQGGTVLINGACLDPTAGLTVDVTEAAEPNHLGFYGVEASDAGAGTIVLGAINVPVVVSGTINPFRDDDGNGEVDPDLDAYLIDVTAPTLVEISVDGVNGLAGAFVVASFEREWRRFGLNVSGDSSRRKIFFPFAGRYAISFGDTRSMFLDAESPPAAGRGAAAGGPTHTYFASFTVLALPTPTALTLDAGVALNDGTLAPEEVQFFSVPAGLGFNEVSLEMPGTPRAALVVLRGTSVSLGREVMFPALATFAGVLNDGDAVTTVVDTEFHLGPGNTPYTLNFIAGSAAALAADGGVASQPELSSNSVFFYDVAPGGELLEVAWAWNQPVSMMVVDAELNVAANFTFSPLLGFTNRTVTAYGGFLRHRAPGRHYVLAFDPASTGPTTLDVASTLSAVTVAPVIPGTPLVGEAVGATRRRAFTYDAGTAPWHLFAMTGDAGVTTPTFWSPAAGGRLSPLTAGGTGTLVEDATPLFSRAPPFGRVLLDDAVTAFLVTTTSGTAGTIDLSFGPRVFREVPLTFGTPVTLTAETLAAGPVPNLYLLRTPANDGGVIAQATVSPITTTLDTNISSLNNLEVVQRVQNPAGAGLTDSTEFFSSGSWTALSVSTPAMLAAPASYTVTFGTAPFIAPTYTVSPGTTPFTDACAGGTTQVLTADGSGNGPANDEGFTASITTPLGFRFFGLAEPSFRASTNGWLSFGAVTTALFANPNMPSTNAPNAIIAPYWDDMANVVICTRTTGSRLTVQWTGVRFNTTTVVSAQAILDGSSGTIEFVYGATHAATSNSATIGIENQAANAARLIGFNQPGFALPSTATLLTP